MTELLTVSNLHMHYFPHRRLGQRAAPKAIHALDDVSFGVAQGETLGVVGESGSGKSTLARCIIGLLRPTEGTIAFDGLDITQLGARQLRALRRDISMVFQDPYASLDPRQRVESIISEPIRVHHLADAKAARSRVRELLEIVGLRPEHADRYPYEFSGGQRQRIGIARALAANPKLIICDEAVSALDVSVQAQVLNLLRDIQQEFSLTFVFISHDLGVVRYVADRVIVMYRGRVVEQGSREHIFETPKHPYTADLLAAVPEPDPGVRKAEADSNAVTQGVSETTAYNRAGCAYASRCSRMRGDRCLSEVPTLRPAGDGHAACFFPLEQTADQLH
jgi:oligopeptide/dipeptide ABC transporter ATP-binding protein